MVHVTAANLSATDICPVELTLQGGQAAGATGRILTGAVDAYNDFDAPDRVTIQAMDGIALEDGAVKFTLPACSVAEITLA